MSDIANSARQHFEQHCRIVVITLIHEYVSRVFNRWRSILFVSFVLLRAFMFSFRKYMCIVNSSSNFIVNSIALILFWAWHWIFHGRRLQLLGVLLSRAWWQRRSGTKFVYFVLSQASVKNKTQALVSWSFWLDVTCVQTNQYSSRQALCPSRAPIQTFTRTMKHVQH